MVKVKLNLLNEELELEMLKGQYSNGRLALELIDLENQQPYCRLTVNIPEYSLHISQILIKTWSENAAVTDAILRQTDIFTDTGSRYPTGFYEASVWTFTDSKILDKMEEI